MDPTTILEYGCCGGGGVSTEGLEGYNLDNLVMGHQDAQEFVAAGKEEGGATARRGRLMA